MAKSKKPESTDAPAIIRWPGVRPIPGLITLLVGVSLWMIPTPSGVAPEAWRLFAVFVATITGIILRPLPVSPVVLISMIAAITLADVPFKDLFAGYSHSTIWLIVFAFFLARGLIKTGLAMRASYWFISKLGKSPLGLSYGLIFSELLLSPLIPSLVARSGGIFYPITLSLAKSLSSGGKGKNTAKFLMLAVFQGSAICSAMFLTAMAANPVALQMASEHGISISWGLWALAASVPGMTSLLVVPWVLTKLVPPDHLRTPEAPKMARKKLAEMGRVSLKEWVMLKVFIIVLGLWLAGPTIGIGSTVAVMIGLALLLLTGVLTWDDCLREKKAWDTFFWLSVLIAISSELKTLGFFGWVGAHLMGSVQGIPWPAGFAIVCLIYFYTHYLFASNTAHILAMYVAFLATAIQLGTPPMMAALMLAVLSNLFGGLTHYSNGPAPIYFGAGYVPMKQWWAVSFAISVVNLVIWFTVGLLWWKVIGIW